MKKKNILVLMGGKSAEHEISLIGGREVVKNLDPRKYNVLPAIISKDGLKLQLVSSNELFELKDPLTLKGTEKNLVIRARNEIGSINEIREKVDVVFIAMHGPYGEDGTVQGMLDLRGFKYTGSGVLASAIGMDKLMFRKIMKASGIKVPNYVVLRKGERLNVIKKLGNPPYFVKPNSAGSSVGASLVRTKKDLRTALEKAFEYDETVLVDEFVKGTEVTCGILGNDKLKVLPLVEIIPKKGDFFDYDSKYKDSGSEEIIPARISNKLTKKVQDIAVSVFKEIGCKGFGRVDLILKNGKYPYVLEINTIPGLTTMSLLPKAANAAGISYTEMLDKVVNYAYEKN